MILSFSYSSTANAALSATTAQVINGTAPYLTFDGGTTKVTTVEGLIGIKLSDGTHYISAANGEYPSATVDTSSVSNPIELPTATDTFADVLTLLPTTEYPTMTLQNLITNHSDYWQDDDGDSTPTATGSLTITWKDVNGIDITNTVKANPTANLSACDAPYSLKIEATAGTLSTQYGVPLSSTFTAGTHTYHIKPKIVAPYACYAKPNLAYGNSSQSAYWGPANQWDPSKGFKFQNSGPNFPTTGSHGLSFELTIADATAQSVIDTMTSTVQATTPTNIRLGLTVASTNVLKVTLQGPKYDTPTGQAAFSPSTFKLKSGATEIYSFTISKWFITTGISADYSTAQNFCTGLGNGYRLPLRSDYTNAGNVTQPPYNPSSNPTHDGDATFPNDNYTRTIGGGLFAEWGWTYSGYYTSSDWYSYDYWTSEAWSSSRQYLVTSNVGLVFNAEPSNSNLKAACVMP